MAAVIINESVRFPNSLKKLNDIVSRKERMHSNNISLRNPNLLYDFIPFTIAAAAAMSIKTLLRLEIVSSNCNSNIFSNKSINLLNATNEKKTSFLVKNLGG
jgi:hypothetical protein